jgi:N6-L-threonylcarbamoyladenine synthase
LSKAGNPDAFEFAKPQITGYNYSFSGLKTSFLYLLRDKLLENPGFVEENKADLCASIQKTIVEVLIKKVFLAAKNYKIKQIALAGGVSANSALRKAFLEIAKKYGWDAFIPAFEFTTDNAAMIAMTGYLKFQSDDFSGFNDVPYARVSNLLK